MNLFRLAHVLALYLFIARVFAFVEFTTYSDGSYAWVWKGNTGVLDAEGVKSYAQDAYNAMVWEAQDKGKNAPKVMAAFYVPSVTTQGVRDGYLVVASSIKGTPGSNVPSAGTSNYCDNQHIHGNCAEIHAFSLLPQGMTCSNSIITAYGIQGSSRPGFMNPCRDRNGKWGCGSWCRQNQVTAITKRSTIDQTPASDLRLGELASDDLVRLETV